MHPVNFYSLWAINGPLDVIRLCRQLDGLKRDGFDGVVFHPRFYPNEPPYLSGDYLRIVSRAILHARDIGLAFWLYDENGWPSGIAGGELLRRHPDDAGGMLALHQGPGARAWHAFDARGSSWHLALQRTREIDYLNPAACGHFLSLTHDRYRSGLDPAAWSYVEAIFTDEPEYGLGVNNGLIPAGGAVPWSPEIEALYRARTGRDFRADLPLVFFNDPDGAHAEVRVPFWEFMTDRLCEGFFAPYHAWCRNEGKLFTGHLKGDEHPLFQVMMNGSAHQVFRHLDLPGIDPLERFPACDYYAREVASSARQFGTGRAMAEAMGGAGWGTTPADLERFLLWLARHGISDLVVHLHQYRLHSHALRDWPPSNPNGLNWRDAYADVLQSVRRQTHVEAVDRADTLVVAPYRGIMAAYEPWSLPQSNIHNCATYPDTEAGRLNSAFLRMADGLAAERPGHHYADERSVEEQGRVEAGRLFVGQHGYDTVIVDDGCRLNATGRALLDRFASAGGRVLNRAQTIAGFTERVSVGQADCRSAGEAFPVTWTQAMPPDNALLLESEREADGARWHSAFEIASALDGPLWLECADTLVSVAVDGEDLPWEPTEEGSRVPLPASCGKVGIHSLTFGIEGTDAGPLFVWLCGSFRVVSAGAWGTGPNGTRTTEGPWRVEAFAPPVAGGEFTTAGWPFASGPFQLSGTFETRYPLPAGAALTFDGMLGDIARVELNGRDAGWVWGPDGRIVLAAELPPGTHSLRLELIPSTYNRFGPHHHRDGDRHVVSPGQFAGKKNFADQADAPERTHDQWWRVKPATPPSSIRSSTVRW